MGAAAGLGALQFFFVVAILVTLIEAVIVSLIAGKKRRNGLAWFGGSIAIVVGGYGLGILLSWLLYHAGGGQFEETGCYLAFLVPVSAHLTPFILVLRQPRRGLPS